VDSIWRQANGTAIVYSDIINILKEHIRSDGKLYIGTDSFIDKNKCIFATAICLHGAKGQRGGKYFFRKVYDKRENFPSMVQRILKEVQESIELCLNLSDLMPTAKIELHMDISPAHKNNGTSKIADMLTGYAAASGFKFKIKPDAWASQSVADKHSK